MNIMTLTEFTTFLGWCAVINYGLMIVSALAIMIWREPIARLHSKLFALDEADMPKLYFDYLGKFKILVIVFNIVPWVALKVMG